MTAFALDPRIAASTFDLGETPTLLFRMMDDGRYPWIVIVPRVAGACELFDLAAEDSAELMHTASVIAARMRDTFAAEKMNIGALGNRVRQLHLHVIARRRDDEAWPDAVWNGSPPLPYGAEERARVASLLRACLPDGEKA